MVNDRSVDESIDGATRSCLIAHRTRHIADEEEHSNDLALPERVNIKVKMRDVDEEEGCQADALEDLGIDRQVLRRSEISRFDGLAKIVAFECPEERDDDAAENSKPSEQPLLAS